VAAEIGEDRLQMTLRFRVMDESGLELAEQVGVGLDVHAILGGSRVDAAEGVFDHRARKRDKVQDALARREGMELAAIKLLPPVVVGDLRVVVDRVVHHPIPCSYGAWCGPLALGQKVPSADVLSECASGRSVC